MNRSKILGQAAGIEWQGIDDQSQQPGSSMAGPLIIGAFKRGRIDRPMAINLSNLNSQLGQDNDNPDYQMVRDALSAGIPFVEVLRISAVTQSVDPVVSFNCSGTNANMVIFGYDYSDQNKYLYNADGSYNYDEYNTNIATIHQADLVLTINGETCPYDSVNQSFDFNQWIQEKTYDPSSFVSAEHADSVNAMLSSDSVAIRNQNSNLGPLVYLANVTSQEMRIDLQFRDNHYYRVVSDDPAAVNKLSSTHYTVCLKPYPKPGTGTGTGTGTGAGTGTGTEQYIVMPFDMDNGKTPQIMSSTPFTILIGQDTYQSYDMGGLYGINYTSSVIDAATAAGQLSILPVSGDTFGPMILISDVLSWGSVKFDIGLVSSEKQQQLMGEWDITDTTVVLAYSGDYSSAAGAPVIVNGSMFKY